MIAIRVQREPSANGATLGALYVNDVFLCWTLEDVMRQNPGLPVVDWKEPGVTAIPGGRYPVILEFSPKFGRVLPELKDVPGFREIKFHAGNGPLDTEGCILVGLERQDGDYPRPAKVLRSREALEKLLTAVAVSGPIFVDVQNPPERHVGRV